MVLYVLLPNLLTLSITNSFLTGIFNVFEQILFVPVQFFKIYSIMFTNIIKSPFVINYKIPENFFFRKE